MPAPPQIEAALMDPLPSALVRSDLFAMGGVGIADDLLGGGWLKALRAEARARIRLATDVRNNRPDIDGPRGGHPACRYLTAPGDQTQDAFYRSEAVLNLLSDIAACPVAATGSRGTYSYYCRSGDYLGLHRDMETCDLAVISVLWDIGAATSQLNAYPARPFEPLERIEGSPHHGCVAVPLTPGQSAVLLGGVVPHVVTPAGPRAARVVSVLCYELTGA